MTGASEGRIYGGRYRAERELGHGGFGVVLAATDVKTEREVALKVLRGPQLDVESRKRFEREARVVQRLAHPNTVRLYDFGVESDGSQYIVYELLEGETLTQLSSRGPIPWERAVKIGSQVLKSLSEAHALGIVHRDVKPANVMLVQFAGDADVVKLLDFGIAKPLMSASKALTETGVQLGTPRFMSPEQVNGDAVSPRSDLYSLGLVLAELVSGQKVFQGNPVSVMIEQVSPAPVPMPSAIRGAPFAPVLERALAKDPAQRFASAQEMLAALESTLTESARSLTPPAVLPSYAPSPTSNGVFLLAIGGGMLVLLGLAGLAFAAIYLLTGPPGPPPAVVVAPAPAAPSVSVAPVLTASAPPQVGGAATDAGPAITPKKSAATKPTPTAKPATKPTTPGKPSDFGY